MTGIHCHVWLPYRWGWCTVELARRRLFVRVSNRRWFFSWLVSPRHWKLSVNGNCSLDSGGGGRALFQVGTSRGIRLTPCSVFGSPTCRDLPSSPACRCFPSAALPCSAFSPHTLNFLQLCHRSSTFLPQGGQNKFQECVAYCKCGGKAGLSTTKGPLAADWAWSVPFVDSNSKYISSSPWGGSKYQVHRKTRRENCALSVKGFFWPCATKISSFALRKMAFSSMCESSSTMNGKAS